MPSAAAPLIPPAPPAAAAARAAHHGVLQPGALELPDKPFSLVDLDSIAEALERHNGNRSATARCLGIPRHVLLHRLEEYGIE